MRGTIFVGVDISLHAGAHAWTRERAGEGFQPDEARRELTIEGAALPASEEVRAQGGCLIRRQRLIEAVGEQAAHLVAVHARASCPDSSAR